MPELKKPFWEQKKRPFKPAVITIDPTSSHVFDFKAGDVNEVQIFDALHLATSVYRDRLIEAYKKETKDKSMNDARFEKWLNEKRKAK